MSLQVPLPFDAPISIVEQEFLEWIDTADGKALELAVTRMAFNLQDRGFRHYSIDALFHAARYDRNLVLGPDQGYRVNDHHTSHMARRLMSLHPALEGFFEVRNLRGRAWRKAKR